MKILILYRHFWPDSPPYASMLRSIARRLVEDGHDLTIWTQKPSYKMSDLAKGVPRHEMLDGIRIERFGMLPGFGLLSPVRLLDKLLFPVRLLMKALWRRMRGERYTLIWTATIPPVAQGMVGRWIAGVFGAKFLYHCQDLYPELGAYSGTWRKAGWIDWALAQIERRNRARADLLVTLSDDMAATVLELAKPRGQLAVINNFMLEDFSNTKDQVMVASRAKSSNIVKLIFAGNLGQFQGLEALVETMRIVERERQDIILSFMGEGKALPALKKSAEGLNCVQFEPHLPFEQAKAEIAAADVGIVSLEQDIYRLAFPSKALTYLGLDLPLLCVIEPDSALAKMVTSNNLGWVAPRSPEAMAQAIIAIGDAKERIPAMRMLVMTWFGMHLDRTAVLERWGALIDDLDKGGTA